MEKKMLFIFNPTAGKAEIAHNIFEIVDKFTKKGYLVTLHPTQSEGDAVRVVKKYGELYDILVCAGGDGTLSESVTALMELEKKPEFGYIPSGTVNDFARSVGIPLDYLGAVDTIINGEIFAFDVGSFNEKYFSYVVGFGAFTNVSYETPQRMKNIFGDLAYFLEGVKQVGNIESYRCEINYDGNVVSGDYILGLISSTTSVGGMIGLTGPGAKMDDGFFELTLIESPKSLMETQEIIASLVSRDLKSELITSVIAKKIWISCEEVLDWTIDGEFGGSYNIAEIINHKKALRVYKKA